MCRDPTMWSVVGSVFAKTLIGEWEAQGTFVWCLDIDHWQALWCADDVFLKADEHTILEPRFNQVVHTARGYGCRR